MWIPPIGVRRALLDPLIFILAVVSVIVSPLLFALAASADLVTRGPWKFVRTTRLFVVFMACEVAGLSAAFGLWVASGFGARIRSPRFRLAHYRLLSWWLGSDLSGDPGRLRVHHRDPQPAADRWSDSRVQSPRGAR